MATIFRLFEMFITIGGICNYFIEHIFERTYTSLSL